MPFSCLAATLLALVVGIGAADVAVADGATAGTAVVPGLHVPRNPAYDPPIPASNPVLALVVPAPPRGYEPVWTDGRINPVRGLPPRSIGATTIVLR